MKAIKYYLAIIALVLLLTPAPVNAQPVDLSNGLVSWWGLDDNHCVVAPGPCVAGPSLDSHQNNALTQWNTPVSSAAVFNYGLYFEVASGDYLSGQYPTLNNVDGMTLSFWLRLDSLTGTQTVISKTDHSSTGWYLEIASTGHMYYRFYNNIGSLATLASNAGVIVADQWQHVVIIDSSIQLSMRVDGVQVAGRSAFTTSSTADLVVGQANDASNPMTGWIDELAYWGRGLSVEEARFLENEGAGHSYYTLFINESDTIGNYGLVLPSGRAGLIMMRATAGEIINAVIMLAILSVGLFFIVKDFSFLSAKR